MQKLDESSAQKLLDALPQAQRNTLVDCVSSAIAVTLQLACDDILKAIPAEYEIRVMDAVTHAAPSIVDTAMAKALFIAIVADNRQFKESLTSDKDSPIAAHALRCGQKFHSKATQ